MILDRYRVIGKAGAGGFATVLHAHDTLLKRDVAIKCIELSENDAARAAGMAAGAAGGAGAAGSAVADVLTLDAQDDFRPLPNGSLPADPSFLDKREERLLNRKGRGNAGRTAAAGADMGAGAALGVNGRGGRSPFPHRSSSADPASTAYINALASVLPGTIEGAGQVEIGGIDGEGVQLSVIGAAVGDTDTHTVAFQGAGSKKAKGSKGANAKNSALSARQPVAMAAAPQAAGHIKGATSIIGDTPSSGSPVAGLLATFPGLDEARAAAKLNDANIVTVYDCVVEGNRVYMIMEYVEGRTLKRVMRDLGNDITLDMISAVFTSVAHALEVAHDSKILHLDVKPENVMISTTGEVKVTDFGLATLMDASGHGTAGAGTIGYMPLEQMRQRSLDVRTDEWALASLTYEMLSGSNPFRANSLKAAEAAINNAELVLPSQCWANINEKVDDVMFMALDPNPDGRYSTIKKFDRALSPLLGNPEVGKAHLKAVMGGNAEGAAAATGEGEAGLLQEAPGGKGGFFGSLFGRKGKNAGGAQTGADADDGSPYDEDQAGSFGKMSTAGTFARPVIDAIGPRGSSIIMRVVAAGGCALLTVMALLNMRISVSDMFGILSSTPLAFYIILAAQIALAAFRPRWGIVMAYAMLSLMFLFNFAWLQGVLMLAGTGVWWWFIGRDNDAASTVALLQPLCGSFGFAAITPVMAGVELDVRDALATTSFAAFSAIMFASLGSADFNYWNAGAFIMLPGSADLASAALWEAFVNTLVNPCTWMTFISWVAAGTLYSLLCRRGTKTFDIIGSAICAAVLIAGAVINITVLGQPLDALILAGVIVSSLIGVLFAAMSIPDRVRLAEGEW